MSQSPNVINARCSSFCVDCQLFWDKSTFLDALSSTDIPGTATVKVTKPLSDLAGTAKDCEICKIILSNAHEFEDESPKIKMEYILGSDNCDIKRINLIYEGPVSEDAGLATGYNQVLRRYMVHTLPGMSTSDLEVSL